MRRGSALVMVVLILSSMCCRATEENDLWLLLSSYEDISITAQDLAFFLATHGYDARPEEAYVMVTFSDGKSVYITPNGAAPRLGDLWTSPPAAGKGPVQVIPGGAIRSDAAYNMSDDPEFLKSLNKYVIFPVTPLGMCYDGSQKLDSTYRSFGYNVMFLYDPAGFEGQGHLWVAVEDRDHPDTWLAVDSYYGIMTSQEYYRAPYSFAEFRYLDALNPQWRVA
ncbi:MAG: hypothetical protein QUS08_02075 [Methanothrix sp.]|nr:hypothetical protein [Methanothrix sp.]